MNTVTMEDTRLASSKKTPVSSILIAILVIALLVVGGVAWSKISGLNKQLAQTQGELAQNKTEMTQTQTQLTEAK